LLLFLGWIEEIFAFATLLRDEHSSLIKLTLLIIWILELYLFYE